jgi:alpha-soluble NSF attachment protein
LIHEKKMGDESKANSLMSEGESSLRRSSIWGFMDPSKKYEEAKDKFQKAANIYKMNKNWDGAAKAFERVADMAEHLDAPHEVIAAQTEAAEMYGRYDKRKATQLYKNIATKNCEAGRFQRAAQMLDSAGALLEEDGDLGEAVECYAKAADYHFNDRANSKGNKSLEKVALISSELGNFTDAAKVFEQLGYTSLESSLLKFGAKKHFLHAGFCYLGKGDTVAAQVGLGRYLAADPTMKDTREHKLLATLITAYESSDLESFTEELASYDRVMTLDRWETSILLKVRKALDDANNAQPDLR